MATNNCINGTTPIRTVGFDFLTYTTTQNTGSYLATDQTPTTANTVLLTSLAYAAQSASSILHFDFEIPWNYIIGGTPLGIFLFAGTTLLYSGVSNNTYTPNGLGGNLNPATALMDQTSAFMYTQVAGTTSSITYSLRYAIARISSNTLYVNSNNAGNSWGGSWTTSLCITEFN